MASSRKKAETKGIAAPRVGKAASPGAGAAGRKVAAPVSSAAKKNEKVNGGAKSGATRPAASDESPRTTRGASAPPRSAAARPSAAAVPKKGITARKSKAEEAAAARKRVATAKTGAPAEKATPVKAVAVKAAARRTLPAFAPAIGPIAGKSKARTARASKQAAAEPVAESRRAARRRGAAAGGKRTTKANGAVAPHAVDGLTEEDQIRAAKYLPRELPKRIFEEERFIFPETYGVNRIRLLVRDPEWIFAYWDVSPAAMKDFAKSIGERTLALSRLTLRVIDPVSGGSTDILLPPGARWWYVRTDHSRRTYRAELGVTLPSGEFRRLAESNTVVTPRVGPSPERARRRLSYPEARELPLSAAAAASEAEKRTGVALEPWAPGAVEGAETPASVEGRTSQAGKGGASDTFRPGGASDAFPGASDTFRR